MQSQGSVQLFFAFSRLEAGEEGADGAAEEAKPSGLVPLRKQHVSARRDQREHRGDNDAWNMCFLPPHH